jgi:spore coat polysaccharide biosynthesis protein SpsF
MDQGQTRHGTELTGPKTGIIVLARMSSSRLPGKSLMDIGGHPMLGLVLERLKRAASALQCKVIIATSSEVDDDAIANFSMAKDVGIFRGSLTDVAGRTLAAALELNLDYFVRISADSPFICPQVIEHAVRINRERQPDLTTNLFPRTFPPGISVEVINTRVFQRLLDSTISDEEREHVTKAFYNNPDDYDIHNFESTHGDLSAFSLTVDTAADLDKARWIHGQLGDRSTVAPLTEIIGLAQDYKRSIGDRNN